MAVSVRTRVLHGPAVVLGARQVTSHVIVPGTTGLSVLRRRSAGTAAYVGKSGLLIELWLDALTSVAADTQPRTLLNRNLRPILRALRRVGVPAAYFGREWIASNKLPLAVVGFDAIPSGEVLIQLVFGWERGVAIPDELKAQPERELDRYRGHEPVGLAAVCRETSREVFLKRLVDALETERIHIDAQPAVLEPAVDLPPEGLQLDRRRRIPIGWLEVARGVEEAWIGGDLLAPGFILDALAARRSVQLDTAPIDGATWSDVIAALDGADDADPKTR